MTVFYFPSNWTLSKHLLWLEERFPGEWIVPMLEWGLHDIRAIEIGGGAWRQLSIKTMAVAV